MLKSVRSAAIAAGAVAAMALTTAMAAVAQQRAPAGNFDFYVLSLSWSPSFCAAAAERRGAGAGGAECGARPYSFIVHGLWPQYEQGYPQFCEVPAPWLDSVIISSMLDLMPARRLIVNEWKKHGTCSGLPPRAYFEMVRKARAAVKIPPAYVALRQPLEVSPAAVEDAFIKANPGLAAADLAIGCGRNRLREVRVCLTKELKFRPCPQVAARSCRRDRLIMPPLRGG